MFMATSVVIVIKMVIIIVPTAEIKPTSLAFRASVLTISPHMLPDVTTLPTPTCLRGLRSQCRLLRTFKGPLLQVQQTQPCFASPSSQCTGLNDLGHVIVAYIPITQRFFLF